jgi:hypothetical protein
MEVNINKISSKGVKGIPNNIVILPPKLEDSQKPAEQIDKSSLKKDHQSVL